MHHDEHIDTREALPASLTPAAGRDNSLHDEQASAGRRPFLDEVGEECTSGKPMGGGRPAGCRSEGDADPRRGVRASSSGVALDLGGEMGGWAGERRGMRRRPLGNVMAMHLLACVVIAGTFSLECQGFSIEELSVGGALCSAQVNPPVPLGPHGTCP